jgi:hypothetical protein
VVELSYAVGQDLSAVHESYRTLVKQRFDDFRAVREAYLKDEWIPTYLSIWIEDGRLVDTANSKVVWSDERGEFVAPPPGREKELLLHTIDTWARVAIEEIDDKRNEVLEPLNKDEAALLASIDDAFDRLYRANATITAHLNSLRKVQEVQDEALQALKLKDLRNKITEALANASDKAQAGLDAVKKAEEKNYLEKAKALRERLRN